MNINQIRERQFNYIGGLTRGEENALKKANFTLPHFTYCQCPNHPDEEIKLDSERVSSVEDLTKKLQEALKDTKKFESERKLSPLKRLVTFLIAAATIAGLVVGGLYCSFLIPVVGGIVYFAAAMVYADKREIDLMSSFAGGFQAFFAPLYDPIFGRPFGRNSHLSVDYVEKLKSNYLKNYDFLSENNEKIKENIDNLKIEKEDLENKIINLKQSTEKTLADIGQLLPNDQIVLEPVKALERLLEEKTELIQALENVLEKIKEVEGDKHE